MAHLHRGGAGETCLTEEALQEQFETASNQIFGRINKKDGVYEGTYNPTTKEVVVKIYDKTQGAKKISGTGLIAGLTDLYTNNNLVKVQVGTQDERDLVALAAAAPSSGMTSQQLFKTIFGSDILNEVQKSGEKTGTLADFINKTVTLKLTVQQKGCDNAVTINYFVEGVDGKDTTAPATPTVTAKEDGSVEITPPTDVDIKSLDITYTPEGSTDPKTATATKGANGKWTSSDKDVTVDPATGKITIAADKVADGSDVEVTAKDKTGNTSKEATAKAKKPTGGKTNPSIIGGYWFLGYNEKEETEPVEKLEQGNHFKYIYGYADKTVRPEGTITRSEAAAMIARLAGLDMSDKSKPAFKDTPSAWYNTAINAMVKKDLMFADKDGNFRPNEPITRGEFARALYYIDHKSDKIAPFADVKGHVYEDAINQAFGNGRIAGYPDGTFKPEAKIQRAEAARILNRFAGRSVQAKGIADYKARLIHFTDLPTSHWAYYEIVEAANSHRYHRMNKYNIEEMWTGLLD